MHVAKSREVRQAEQLGAFSGTAAYMSSQQQMPWLHQQRVSVCWTSILHDALDQLSGALHAAPMAATQRLPA